MQSGYSGGSEIPQFLIENDMVAQHELKYHPLVQPHHPNIETTSLPTPLMPQFMQFHSFPITQQLFQQPQHQFQLFQHHQTAAPQQQLETQRLFLPHQLGLDQDSLSERIASPIGGGGTGGGDGHSFLADSMGFKLAMSDNCGSRGDGLDEARSENRLHNWQRDDESAMKEPSWRPLDIDYINTNNNRCKYKEVETSSSNYYNKSKEVQTPSEQTHPTINGIPNYKVFSELEAIYKPGSGANQAGSGSALTGDETPIVHSAFTPELPINDHHVGVSTETSAEEDTPMNMSSKSNRKLNRKRRRQQQFSYVASLFENLVKKLIEHQEELNKKFLEVMGKREQELTKCAEAWRKQEANKLSREADARAQERALAASRKDAIIAFIEKMTGESLQLPPIPQDQDTENYDFNNMQFQILPHEEGQEKSKMMMNTSRWTKAEVQVLIRVRSGLECRFQEPGLKGPLWEEVSRIMGALGYQRSAKRCKEKWENINKYFRKTKECGKKKRLHSKTCPYFHQLEQLYSKPLTNSPLAMNLKPSMTDGDTEAEKKNSELLDAILGKGNNEGSDSAGQGQLELHAEVQNNHKGNENDENEDDGSDDPGGEEGERESNDDQNEGIERQLEDENDDLHESALFFQRLQS